jgi:cytochrome c oxidase assembly protein subunit 15
MLLWTALGLLRPKPGTTPAEARLRPWIHAAAGFAFLTMLAGGFVAGIRAGFSFNTFPLMDGQLLPNGYWQLSPAWHNMTANVLAVQFNHRLLATLTLLAAGYVAWRAWRGLPASAARTAVMAFAGSIVLQYALGVATLLAVVPVSLGTLHQGVAVLVLTTALLALHRVRRLR